MKINNDTPVVVLGGNLGGLAISRSLGKLSIDVHVFDENRQCAAFQSKYCKTKTLASLEREGADQYCERILSFGQTLGNKPILIPTSDELSIFVSEYASKIKEYFRFHALDLELVHGLASKKTMFSIAKKSGVPTASALFPQSTEEVVRFAENTNFPIMLKGIFGNRLQSDSGKKMLIIKSPEELVSEYRKLSVFDADNLMIQEYIPGEDNQVYIFNGYFDKNSDCLAAFTGRKIRQFPIHVGCASLGECCWNEQVSLITTRFMKNIGYQGILDIGYRYDERDGQYKVLDINPRVGQAFRMFVDKNGMDVVRALYLDLTDQRVERGIPREGRRWVIEDYDIISSFHYFQEGSIKLQDWIGSFKKLEECMWFDLQDPMPFSDMVLNLSKRALAYIVKRALSQNGSMSQ